MTPYLLDTNVFIEAKNRYYSFAVCPGFWAWIEGAGPAQSIATIDQVRDEILRGKDELAAWVKARRSVSWILETDDKPTQDVYRDVVAKVQAGPWTQAAKDKFLMGADPWLVAKAKVMGTAVVTHEGNDPRAKARVPLATVCKTEGVPFLITFDALEQFGAEFVLAAARTGGKSKHGKS